MSVSIIGVLGLAIGTDTTAGFMAYVGLTILSLTIALINAFFNRWGAS